MQLDIHNINELDSILANLGKITALLTEAMDENVEIKSKVYRALADTNISNKLSMEAKLIELVSDGKGELVDEYNKSCNEVAKLKHHLEFAEKAFYTKKQQNELLAKI